MSEYFELDGENEDQEPEAAESEFEADPSTVAFLDQEQQAFAEIADEFETMYGFRHDCHCAEDYSNGKVGEVTECYAGMVVDALATCAKFNYENKQLRQMVSTLVEMNNNLMDSVDDEDAVIQREIDEYAKDEPVNGDN